MAKSSDKQKIAIAAAEMTPYAKVGGLADVIGSLPLAFTAEGADVCVVLPGYRSALRTLETEPIGKEMSVAVGNKRESFAVRRGMHGDVPVYLIEHPGHFDRDGIYGERTDYPDNLQRFVFFGRAAALTLAELIQPDVVHAHDWHCALLPIVMRADPALREKFARTLTLFTIHNMAFQGIYDAPQFALLNLDRAFFSMNYLEFFGRMNLMKGAVALADAASTVSPTYAREVISDPELGFGLEGVLRNRGERFVGILNGADYHEWNPATDDFIAARYDADNRRGKDACGRDLREHIKLPPSAGRPLAGMISRITPQKGFDLLVDALPGVMAAGLELVILGSGDPAMQDYFKTAEQRYPDQLRTIIGFDNPLAHKIQAGCDMFLMPSKFEPCGLTQMYALKYGTAPIVRATGGLADTITEFDPKSGRGNGFVFAEYKPEKLIEAVVRAVAVYRQKEIWSRLMDNAFAADFSWRVAARRYLDLFARIASWRASA